MRCQTCIAMQAPAKFMPVSTLLGLRGGRRSHGFVWSCRFLQIENGWNLCIKWLCVIIPVLWNIFMFYSGGKIVALILATHSSRAWPTEPLEQ